MQGEVDNFGKSSQQEVEFFRGKLLEAEAYITDLVKEVKDLKENTGSSDELLLKVEHLTLESV